MKSSSSFLSGQSRAMSVSMFWPKDAGRGVGGIVSFGGFTEWR